MTPSPGHLGFFRCRELQIVALLALAALFLLMAFLALVAAGTDWLMLDFRDWQPDSSRVRTDPEFTRSRLTHYFRRIQTRSAFRRPLRLTLALEQPPSPGDFFAAEKTFEVDQDSSYCFRVFVNSPYFNPESQIAIKSFRVLTFVNGSLSVSSPIADRRGEVISLEGIRPQDGRITLRFEVRALRRHARESWRRASTVHFEFATLQACPSSHLGSPPHNSSQRGVTRLQARPGVP